MKFDAVTIKNFRNFEDITIDLTNKNVLFGMNDVGKTNFLYALRFLFDKDIRRQNFTDTDYYKKNTNTPIEILVSIDIGDTEDGDSQKLRAKLKGAILSGQDKVYIKVKAIYDEKEMVGIPVLYWGGDAEDLEEMKVHGTFFEIDYVFNVFYIDAYVDLYSSKGLEFEQVVLFVSDYRLANEEDIYNHYVAATRAKTKLILVYINNDWNAGQFRKNINEILEKSSLKMKDIATVVSCMEC